MSDHVLSPSIAQGFYPERKIPQESKLDQFIISALGNMTRRLRARPGRFKAIVPRVNLLSETLGTMTEDELQEDLAKVRQRIKADGLIFEHVARAFGLVREFAHRRIGIRHFDVQLIGGWILLNGMVAEMETGEGKTLTATLPACTAALAGVPVHLITVNDYLADRDAQWMKPVYEAMGLSVGVIVQGMSPDERRDAYRCDVTYCTNKEIVFDYLKDRILLGQQPGQIQMRLERLHDGEARLDKLVLRGLPFAIIDEADSVLIDEARTPLIISGQADSTWEAKIYQEALELCEQLEEDEDYTLDLAKRTLELTDAGKEHIKDLAQPLGSLWTGRNRREELARQALTAVHLFEKDRDYIIRDDKVHIVDEYTGRVMADRSWERGLHQLIEAKEGCEITSQNVTLARISYQRFFRRYHHLGGMTGTAKEVANELWSVYRVVVVPVPTNRPVARKALPFKVYRAADDKWREVVERITGLHDQGRPVLVGTRFVSTSEHLSLLLREAELPHRVLNARQDEKEAEIIAQAGQMGQITVATNMAGRGTDIALGPGVKEMGGLHVIATELHDAKRIDRQLFGRCGRQGDPGSFEAIISLEDNLFAGYIEMIKGRVALKLTDPGGGLGQWVGHYFTSGVQRTTQRKHFHMRRDLLKIDESIQTAMAFSGRGE
jgi:preprotein translocase subunit SecA